MTISSPPPAAPAIPTGTPVPAGEVGAAPTPAAAPVAAHAGKVPAVTALEVTGLTKRFGSLLAVDDLSFTVAPGTITGFLGPNGSGKSTTLRAVLGLISPTSGTATFGGRAYRQLLRPACHVGAVLESSAFHSGRRARDHLRVLATAAGIPRDRVADVLDTVGLTHAAERRVKGFSRGMRQRLGLAAALLGEPDVLILDEPANGLDPEGVHWLRGLLRSFADAGGTVLMSSHLLAEMAQTVDHIVIIANGRLVLQSSMDALTARATSTVRVRTPRPEALRQALAAAGIHADTRDTDTLLALDATTEQVGLAAAGAGVVIYEITTDRADLETIFLELTATATATNGTPR